MATTTNNPVVLAVTDDESAAKALASALQSLPQPVLPRRVGPAAAAAALRADAPHAAVIFLEHLDAPGSALVAELVAARPETALLVALGRIEKSTLVTLIKLGAADVLELPLKGEEVAAAVATILGRREAGESAGNGRIWSVFGAGGGCGTTSVAVNLAERLARTGGTTAIADFNLEMGDVAVFLNMRPRYTLTDVVLNSGKLDGAYLGTTVAAHASGLRVLPGPREIEDADEVTPERLRTVLRQLRGAYDNLVVDTPSVFNETTIEALDASDGILLVAMLNIPSIRNAKRIRAAFDRLGYPPAKIRLVINRFEKKADISVDEASALVGLPVFHTVPNDYPSVIRAINVGEPVHAVSPKSQVTRAFEALAAKLKSESKTQPAAAVATGAEPAAKSGWLFSRKG